MRQRGIIHLLFNNNDNIGGGVDFLGLFDVIRMIHGTFYIVYFKNIWGCMTASQFMATENQA